MYHFAFGTLFTLTALTVYQSHFRVKGKKDPKGSNDGENDDGMGGSEPSTKMKVSAEGDASSDNSASSGPVKTPAFKSFEKSYLIVYYLMMAGDWLQGPYVYALYDVYGYSKAEIAQLFVVGFGSSMIVGTFVGSLADKLGRRRFCELYCALYIASCVSKHVNNFYVLMLGRLLGGTATSLLFSVFESWLVCEHHKRGFPEALLSSIFSTSVFGNSLVAIVCGVIAQGIADSFTMRPLGGYDDVIKSGASNPGIYVGGYTAPFDLAIVILAIGWLLIVRTWPENYGNDLPNSSHGNETNNQVEDPNKPNASSKASFSATAPSDDGHEQEGAIRTAMNLIVRDRSILLLGIVQSLFESAMYCFVFMWTPALSSKAPPGSPPPFGLIFSTFMLACMLGSQAFGELTKKLPAENLLQYVFLVSIFALATVPFDNGLGTNLSYPGFLLFEIAVGCYFPSISTVKGRIVPESQRATVYNLFRVPLNAVVLFVLLNDFTVATTFSLCVGLLVVALAAATMLLSYLKDSKRNQGYEKVSETELTDDTY